MLLPPSVPPSFPKYTEEAQAQVAKCVGGRAGRCGCCQGGAMPADTFGLGARRLWDEWVVTSKRWSVGGMPDPPRLRPRRPGFDLELPRPVVVYISRNSSGRGIVNEEELLRYIVSRYNVTLRVTTFEEPLVMAMDMLNVSGAWPAVCAQLLLAAGSPAPACARGRARDHTSSPHPPRTEN